MNDNLKLSNKEKKYLNIFKKNQLGKTPINHPGVVKIKERKNTEDSIDKKERKE